MLEKYAIKEEDCKFNVGKIFLKEPHTIMCASVWDQEEHFNLEIKDYIEVYTIESHEITFLYKNVLYIYWADMSMFLKRFKTIDEIRDKKLSNLIEN